MANHRIAELIKHWKRIPLNYPLSSLQTHLTTYLFHQGLNLNYDQIIIANQIGNASKSTILIYNQLNQPPKIVVETRERNEIYSQQPIEGYHEWCTRHKLYQSAIGDPIPDQTNQGIKQHLDPNQIPTQYLADYGLVFNGDFFQLWKRKEGLIIPLTPIQKVTPDNLPQLIQQLHYCLNQPPSGIVTTMWSQKNGVGKTTNTINLSATLALKGKKVLLIDLDPQSDLSMSLNVQSTNDNYLLKLAQLLHKEQLTSPSARNILTDIIQQKTFATTTHDKFDLSIIPSNFKIINNFRDEPHLNKWEKRQIIKTMLISLATHYDHIFIDLDSRTDFFNLSILDSCDTILIPVDYGAKSLDYAAILSQSIIKWRQAKYENNPLGIGPFNLGLVFTNCPLDKSDKLQTNIKKYLERYPQIKKINQSELLSSAQIKNAEYQKVPVICWIDSAITKLYQNLAQEAFLNYNFINN